MNTYIKKIYFTILALAALFICYIILFFDNSTFNSFSYQTPTIINNYELYNKDNEFIGNNNTDDLHIPAGDIVYFYYTVPTDINIDDGLMFSSAHQNIYIYCDNVLLFSFSASTENPFGNTAGYGHHLIKELYNYRGKTLSFSFSSPYTMTNSSFNEMFLGDYLTIFLKLVSTNIVSILISGFTFVVGLILLLFWIFGRRKAENTNVLCYLGIFSITMAIWCVNESPLIVFLGGNHVFASYLSFVSLMLMPIPFVLFIREFFHNRNHKYWIITTATNLSIIALSIILQISDIVDFKNTLYITHICFILLVISIVAFAIYDIKKHKMSTPLKINLISLSFVVIGLIMDLISYYNRNTFKISYMGNFFLLLYIVFIGIYVINHTTTLVAEGVKSKHYKIMAYTDDLTGLSNRTAMNNYINKADYENDSYIIAMFDLNNLKQCNDNYGHNEGDKYIKICASIISNAFNEIGKCYRIGGDEFCVIIPSSNVDKYDSCINELLKELEKTNATGEYKVDLSIAYGFASYSKDLDKNLTETRARADAEMYKCKYQLKFNQDVNN